MGEDKDYSAGWWHNKIVEAEKRLKDEWWTSADAIIKKYKAKKSGTAETGDVQYLLNIFWANVGVLKAALYAKSPKPMVERVWSDMDDNIGRVASLILQRCLGYDFMKNNSPMSTAFKMAVEDRLIPGLGCLWMRYSAEMETVSVPGSEDAGGKPVTFEVVSTEDAPCDYVQWRDVVYPSARIWEEVWFVARKIYMTKSAFKDKFNTDVDQGDSAGPNDPDKILPKNFGKGKVTVLEIWCKRTKCVYWICKEKPTWCQKKDDFLELDDFYPCPKFLIATHTTDDFLPRPDYTMVRDQYDQLTELNTRIVILEKALRVVGVYDKKNAEVSRILTDARENDMIPVDKWAVLAEAGGLKGVVDWFPMEMVANVLEKLTIQKASKIQEIYELTGISDIMRGSTNPRETLGAQELKSQYSSVRLQYLQGEVSEFVREALVIKAQIICRYFQDETIKKWSNIMSTPDAQFADQAIQLLRDSQMTEYKVDINEEGLALPDYNQEKQTRIEFLTTVGQFLSQAAPITQAMPGALPYLVQMIRWVAAGLRGSNEIQGILDQAINSMQQNPPQPPAPPPPPPPDPTRIEQEKVKQQSETQRVGMKFQLDEKLAKTKADLDLRNAVAIENVKAGAEEKQAVNEALLAQEQVSVELHAAAAEAERDRQHESMEGQRDRQHEAVSEAQDRQHESIAQAQERQHASKEADAGRKQELEVQRRQPKPQPK